MSSSSSDMSDSDISTSGSDVSRGGGAKFDVDDLDPDDVDSDGVISDDSDEESDSTGRGPQISEIDSQDISDSDFSEGDDALNRELEGDAATDEPPLTKSAISEIESQDISYESSDNKNEISDSSEEIDKKRPSVAVAAPASPTKKTKATDDDDDDESISGSSGEISSEEKIATGSNPAPRSAFGSYSDISEYSEELSFSSEEDRPMKAKAKPVPVIRDPAIIGYSTHKNKSESKPEEQSSVTISSPDETSVPEPVSQPEHAVEPEPVSQPEPEVEVEPELVPEPISEPVLLPAPKPKPKPVPVPVPASPKKSKKSPSSDSDSDSSSAPKPTKKKSFLDSSSDSSSSDESKKKIALPAVKKKSFFDDSDSDQSSDYSTDSSDERAKQAKSKAKEPPPKPKVSLSDLRQEGMTNEERKAKVAEAAAGLWNFKRPEELILDDEPDMPDTLGMPDFFIPPPPPMLLLDPDLPDEIESSFDPFAPPPPPVLLFDPDLPEEIESNIDEMIAEEEAKAAAKRAAETSDNAVNVEIERAASPSVADQAAIADSLNIKKEEEKKKKKKSFLDSSSSSDEDSSRSSTKGNRGKKSASPKKKKSILDSSSDEDSSDSTSASSREKKATTQPDPKKKSSHSSESDSDLEETDDINSVMSDSRPQNMMNDVIVETEAADPAIEPVLLHAEKPSETHHSVARHHRSSVNIDDNQSNRCSACEQRAEFCPDGLFPCSECQRVLYCSQDCARWHFERGGHNKYCRGGPDVREIVALDDKEIDEQGSDKSVDLFSGDLEDDTSPVLQEGIMAALVKSRAETDKSREETLSGLRCKACGMDQEFVPEGMTKCLYCPDASYCSTDCRQWDWARGGHRQVCQGATDPDQNQDIQEEPNTSPTSDSENSIVAFEAKDEESKVPQTHEGILVALSTSQAETAVSKNALHSDKLNVSLDRCKACGIDKEFVPDGMIMCSQCSQVPYCSKDCMQWDLQIGGHRKICLGGPIDTQKAGTAMRDDMVMTDASEESIVPFGDDDVDQNVLQSQDGILAALTAARTESSSKINLPKSQPTVPQDKCRACGMDKEFVPEGILMCQYCNQIPYCCADCMQWDWENGGHAKICSGARKPGIIPEQIANNSDGSLDVLAADTGEQGSPQSKEGILAALRAAQAKMPSIPQDRCRACGMEKEFVPDGMLLCQYCNQVPYCCDDCMQWDWENGDHKAVCQGAPKVGESKKMDRAASDNGSDGSIGAFEADTGGAAAPESKEGLLAALSAARTDSSRSGLSNPQQQVTVLPTQCRACGTDVEFVPEGMIPCKHCSQVVYCSSDCLKWDWDSGGHNEACKGFSGAGQQLDDTNKAVAESDEDSIEPVSTIDEGRDSEAPQSKEGVLTAMQSARNDNAGQTLPAMSPSRDQSRQLDITAQATKERSEAGSGSPANGGATTQQEKSRSITGHTPSTIPPTSQSLRDQITGGTDPQQQIELYAQPKHHGYDVNVLKLELERTKRQYNEAMLSKASLERSLKESEGNLPHGSVVTTPRSSIAARSVSPEAFAAFLDRAKAFLLNSGQWPILENQAIAQQQSDLLLQAGLGESITEFEKCMEAYASYHNELLAEKNAFQKAYEESEAQMKVLRQNLIEVKASGMAQESKGQARGVPENDNTGQWETLAKTIAENRGLREDLDTAKKEYERLCLERESIERSLKEKEALFSKLCEALVTLEGRVSYHEGQNKSLHGELERTEYLVEQLKADKIALEKALKDSELEISILRRSLLSFRTNKEAAVKHAADNNGLVAEAGTVESGNDSGGVIQRQTARVVQPARTNSDKVRSVDDTPRTNHMTSNFRSPSSMLAQSFVHSDQAKRERIGLSSPQQQQRDGLRDPGGMRLSESYENGLGKRQDAHPRFFDPSVRNGDFQSSDVKKSANGQHERQEKSNGSKKYNVPNDFGSTRREERALPDPIATEKSNLEFSLSPAERRMVFIQQQIANAVQTAKHSTSPSPPAYARHYGVQGVSSTNGKSPLRPRYKEPSSAPPAAQKLRSHHQDSKMVDRLAMPSLAPDRHQTPRGYPAPSQIPVRRRPYVQLPRAPLPSYNHTMRVPSRNLTPGGTTGLVDKAPTNHKIKVPQTKNGASHQNKPRLVMMEEVAPGAQAEKDDRWKQVLKSSQVLN